MNARTKPVGHSNAHSSDVATPLLAFVRQVAAFSRYGDGPDELADNEDAALALNALIEQAAALCVQASGER